jgi:hypothetical protein
MATGNLASVVVAVDGSEESMNALRWALDNLRLRPDGELVVLHVQPPPNIAAGLNPAPIPFGGPSKRTQSRLAGHACSLVTDSSSSCPSGAGPGLTGVLLVGVDRRFLVDQAGWRCRRSRRPSRRTSGASRRRSWSTR